MARNEEQSGDRRGGLIGSVPGGVGRRGGRPARGGTVLIMVVALLTVLFVAGAAFLSTVSFQSRSITAVQEAQEESRVIQALSTEVREALRKNFVGNDGIPWNQELLTDADTDGTPESPSAIGSDICGELPGINPLLASIDPYDESGAGTGPWAFYGTTDLERTLESKAMAFDVGHFPKVVANTTLAVLGEVDERGSFYDRRHARRQRVLPPPTPTATACGTATSTCCPRSDSPRPSEGRWASCSAQKRAARTCTTPCASWPTAGWPT